MQHPVPARLPGTSLLTITVTAVLLAFATDSRAAEARTSVSRATLEEESHAASTEESRAARTDEPRAAMSRAIEDAADRAVRALSPYVSRTSHPRALHMAFTAYYNYLSARTADVRNPYFYFVDFGLDNTTARGYVFDMNSLKVVEGPFTVAHGSGSGGRYAVPTRFSNRPGSKQSSLGLYLAQETYGFNGRAGGRPYKSIGLRFRGVSGRFNNAARRRGIVAHGAPYVRATDAGRSSGCPAMEQQRARRLLPMLANGGLMFIFSPHDERWMRQDPWVNAH